MSLIDVNALQRKKASAVEGARSIITAAESRDDTNLTEEERSKFDAFQKEAEDIEGEISRAAFLNKQELDNGTSEPEERDNSGFSDFGSFVAAVRNGNSSKLEERNVSMGDGESMGFLVPETFDTSIRALQPKTGIVRGSATVIPAGSTPDAAINLTTLDQTGDKGVFGGLQTYWTGENQDVQDAGEAKIKQVKLEPNNITAYIDISNKLLNNTTAVSPYLMQLLAGTMHGAEEDAFWANGDGIAKPLAVLKSKAVIQVKRTTANKITYDDLVAMFSKTTGNGTFKWVISRSILPELQKMTAPGGTTPAWQPSTVVGQPSTILGQPVEFNPYSQTLGNYGDIALVDLSYYVIKDGTGLTMFTDPYTQRKSNNTRIYASWNVDGNSLLSDSMLDQDKTSRISPFVALK